MPYAFGLLDPSRATEYYHIGTMQRREIYKTKNAKTQWEMAEALAFNLYTLNCMYIQDYNILDGGKKECVYMS
jgi:hypothetical protein